MEWVETTAETIEAAKNLALDQLGVAEDDAEFEILEEPKQGLFGRTRGEARVRARVRPTTPRAKADRRDAGRKRPKGSKPQERRREQAPRAEKAPRAPRPDTPPVDPTTVSAAATTFLEGLLQAAGVTGTVQVAVSGEDIDVAVTGDGVEMFVGPKGSTLLAIQDLTRVVSQRRLGDHDTHLRVDIAQYRERRREALGRFARKVADDVIASGQPRVLEPMNAADRKIVHDTLIDVPQVATRSQGQDPHRRVVVELADESASSDH